MATRFTAGDVSEAFAKVETKAGENALALVSAGTKHEVGEMAGKMWGLAATYGIDAYMAWREYKGEQKHLRHFYEPEIAAAIGKLPMSRDAISVRIAAVVECSSKKLTLRYL